MKTEKKNEANPVMSTKQAWSIEDLLKQKIMALLRFPNPHWPDLARWLANQNESTASDINKEKNECL